MPPTFSRAAWANGDKLNATNLNAERSAVTSYVDASVISDTRINMLAYGLPTDGSSNCATAMNAAMAANPGGGTFTFPPGTYRLNTGHYDLTGGNWTVEGQGWAPTVIYAPNDADDALFVVAKYGGFRNIQVVGPGTTNKDTLAGPSRRGIVLLDNAWLDGVYTQGFKANAVISGNHQQLRRFKSSNGRWNLAWMQNAIGYTTTVSESFTHGNQRLDGADLTGAGEASIYVDGSSKIDASTFTDVHTGFGPWGMMFAPAAGQQMALGGGSIMDGVSFESCGNGYIVDNGWNTANRRMSKGVKWIAPRSGPQDPSWAVGGVGGIEMVKLGICQDWTIEGVVGDDSNTSFGSVGWGTTSTACGFRFEQCNGFYFKNADNLWNNAGAQSKPMFRWEGGLLDWSDVYFTILDGGYVCSVLKNGSGGTLTNEKLVCGVTAGNPTGTSGVKQYDGTAPAIGRLIPGGPLNNGLMVPVAYEGRFNGPYTTDSSIVAGSALAPDAANGGVKRRTATDQQDVGVAHAAPGVGVGAGQVLVSLRFPWTAKF